MEARLVFDVLTEIAVDPMLRQAWLEQPRKSLAGAGLTPEQVDAALFGIDEDVDLVADGDFAACRSCGDPGPDPFPERHHDRGAG